MNDLGFVNKVEASGIRSVDLLDYQPKDGSVGLDLKDFLYMGLIVREKEFKDALTQYPWESLKGKTVAIFCTEDAIIPSWVHMMIAERLTGVAECFSYTDAASLDLQRWISNIKQADFEDLKGKKVVVKARPNIEPALFMAMTERLKPIVKTLLYGEVGMPKVIYKG